jgi:uncharacterized protein (TIGR03435 family)
MLSLDKYNWGNALAILTIRRVRFAWLMLSALCCAGLVRAQDTPGSSSAATLKIPAYEVVSIRPATDPVEFRGAMDDPDGTHIIHTLKGLVSYAYGVRPEFVACELKLCDSVTFDIRAKVEAGDVTSLAKLTSEQRGLMLKATLAERFGVKVHTEARPLRVYELVVTRGGAKLRERARNAPANTVFRDGWLPDGVTMLGASSMRASAVTMTSLAKTLSGIYGESVERPVVDKTGLQGKYDVDLQWTASKPPLAVGKDSQLRGPQDETAPSIFTALQEQLGLKLQPATDSMQVIVVDAAHMPSAN